MARTAAAHAADVVVVGAGPAGSSAAWHLASAGLDVALLEKAEFPREKVCGDGLTPRGVQALHDMGVGTDGPGWVRRRGLRVHGGGRVAEVDWPRLDSWPDHGLVRTRRELDALLAEHARSAGARLVTGTTVTEPLLDDDGRVAGVRGEAGDGEPVTWRAPLVVSAEGLSGRLAKALGLLRRTDRPLGVALRGYVRSRRSDDEYLDIAFDLTPDGPSRETMPGYGWIFGMGDGTANVGYGLLDTRRGTGADRRSVLRRWLDLFPAEEGLGERDAVGPLRGAGLPMALSRGPAYTRGLLLAGDAAGTVNPCNGEGISAAIESGRMAAESAAAALARPAGAAREAVLQRYPDRLRAELGRHHRLGLGFLALLARPAVVRVAMARGLRRPAVTDAMLRVMGNLSDGRDGDLVDRALAVLLRLTPAT
ncbi:geranylgeranyl reductase family protein [Blastococcus sp. MG754426]|uniref:geranylgeranyl reductase family protein n=1 Tax=unclassified Blastococcus TaxID=2619396 RepID=UPI001EF0A247|nr:MULTISPECIES: geranylgeranyl reductase family protein [unclassified Blastococcus]MCF6507713.1 geranylgeranyl reductase family protein [Blastococcus sp. MG754426]MCF6512259.1 geranylgeranyl reductase family protein [Blastococcus sp. MG754427]MCF6735299.1 geranylgeranyl reductase family protein [Blastococcus sp. KM273129]